MSSPASTLGLVVSPMCLVQAVVMQLQAQVGLQTGGAAGSMQGRQNQGSLVRMQPMRMVTQVVAAPCTCQL